MTLIDCCSADPVVSIVETDSLAEVNFGAATASVAVDWAALNSRVASDFYLEHFARNSGSSAVAEVVAEVAAEADIVAAAQVPGIGAVVVGASIDLAADRTGSGIDYRPIVRRRTQAPLRIWRARQSKCRKLRHASNVWTT